MAILSKICYKTYTRVPYITRESSIFAPIFVALCPPNIAK